MVPLIFGVNCLLFLLSVFVCCYTFGVHAKHVFNPPAQVVVVRFAFIFILTAVSFFLQFLATEITLPWSTESIVHDMVEELITGLVEGIMLFSFFFLLVVHVGGTDKALQLFTSFYESRTRSATTLLTPNLGTPDPEAKDTEAIARKQGVQDYFRYRQVLFMFAIVRPLVSIGMVVNRWYNNWEIRMAMAIINILITLSAVVVLMLTMQRLLPSIHTKYCVFGKFFVVKGLLLVRSFQWAVYCLILKDYDEIGMLRAYYTGCSIECFLFCLAFAYTFRPSTFEKIGRFPSMPFTTVWDVTMHPIPECSRPVDEFCQKEANMKVSV